MSDVRVFLLGEGRNELGSWSSEPEYQDDSASGVIVTLLRRASSSGWVVGGAQVWSRTNSTYRAKPHSTKARGMPRVQGQGDTRTVKVAANDALDAKCSILALVRDEDGVAEREKEITSVLAEHNEPSGPFAALTPIGGVAAPKLEAWVLAALGETKTELLSSNAADCLVAELNIKPKDTAAFVKIFENTHVVIPKDATRLRAWLARAEEVLKATTLT